LDEEEDANYEERWQETSHYSIAEPNLDLRKQLGEGNINKKTPNQKTLILNPHLRNPQPFSSMKQKKKPD